MKFTRDLIIRFEHCDAAGLIFYPRFFGLVNETVEDWFASLGHSFKSLHVDQRKGVPTVHFECEFVGPVRIGDLLHQQLGVDAAPTWKSHLDKIGQIVESAESLEALDQALLAAFSYLPTDELATAMQAGSEAAYLLQACRKSTEKLWGRARAGRFSTHNPRPRTSRN